MKFHVEGTLPKTKGVNGKVHARLVRGGKCIHEERGDNSLTFLGAAQFGRINTGALSSYPDVLENTLNGTIFETPVTYWDNQVPKSVYTPSSVSTGTWEFVPGTGAVRVVKFTFSAFTETPVTYRGYAWSNHSSTSRYLYAYYNFETPLSLTHGDVLEVEHTLTIPYAYDPSQPYPETTFELVNGTAEVVYKDVDGAVVSTDNIDVLLHAYVHYRAPTTATAQQASRLNLAGRGAVSVSDVYISKTPVSLPQPKPNTTAAYRLNNQGRDVTYTGAEGVGASMPGATGSNLAGNSHISMWVERTITVAAGGEDLPLHALYLPIIGGVAEYSGLRMHFTSAPLIVPATHRLELTIRLNSQWDPPQGYIDDYPDWVHPSE